MAKTPLTKMYSFRLYVDEMDKLKKVAVRRRTTVTDLMRAALRKVIDRKR